MILRMMVIRWGRRILMLDKLQDHRSFILGGCCTPENMAFSDCPCWSDMLPLGARHSLGVPLCSV